MDVRYFLTSCLVRRRCDQSPCGGAVRCGDCANVACNRTESWCVGSARAATSVLNNGTAEACGVSASGKGRGRGRV